MESLQKDGVLMSAVDKAIAFCRLENDKCVVKSVNVFEDTSYEVEDQSGFWRRSVKASAQVQGIDNYFYDRLIVRDSKAVEGKDTWKFSTRISTLKKIGIQYGAFTQAMRNCYEQGFDFCTFIKSESTAVDAWDSEESRYVQTAKAWVRGYKLRQRREVNRERPLD